MKDILRKFLPSIILNVMENLSVINEAVEKKDWEKLTVLSRKPLFGFIEIELVKSFIKWILS